MSLAKRDSISEEMHKELYAREQSLHIFEGWLRDDDLTLIGHNLPFDLGVVASANPRLLPAIFEKYEKGLFRDTMTVQQLIDVAEGQAKFFIDEETGEPKKSAYSLADLSYRLNRRFVKKSSDTWRLRYALLDGVPVEAWPEDARRYAIDDAEITLEVFEAQQRIVAAADWAFNEDTRTHVLPNVKEQHKAAWALHLMALYGIRTDGAAVAVLKEALEKEYAEYMTKLRPSGLFNITPARVNRKGRAIPELVTRNMKVIYERVSKCFTDRGENAPLTDTGRIATDRKTLKASGEEGLLLLAEAGATAKLLTTYLPVLERGTKYPINPRYNVLMETGRTSCSNPNCFDGETEVLTKKGWVKFSSYGGEKVAQYGIDGSISFVEPVDVQRFHYRGNLLSHTNEHISLMTTAEHRCLLRNRRTDVLKVFPALEYPEDWQQICAGKYAGGPGLDLSDGELKLLVALQADGSYHAGGLDFCFYKERKIKRFRKILAAIEDADWGDGEKTVSGEVVGRRFRVYKDVSAIARITDLLGPRKLFGPWILQMSRHQLDLFCEEVFHWDGCFARMSQYASSEPTNADWVQIALTLSGTRAKVRIYHNGNPRAKLSHQVDVSYRDCSMTTNVERAKVPHDGLVYCVTVPSSYIVVRRDARVMITGNCQNPPRKGGVRECFVPRPGYVYTFCDYDTLELRALAQVCLDILGHSTMAEALHRGEDLHLSLAAELLGITLDEANERMASGDPEIREYRQQAKPANFGYPGGMGAEGFREYAEGYGINISKAKAEEIRSAWFRKWPEMESYFAFISRLTERSDQLTQLRSGRVRGGASFCAAANSFFQGLAADGAKEALWNVARECYTVPTSPLYGCRPVLFLHDEVGLEVPYSDPMRAWIAAERLAEVMIESMQKWIPDVPITCKPVMVRRWFKGAEPVRVDGILVPSKPVKDGKRTTWVADMEATRPQTAAA